MYLNMEWLIGKHLQFAFSILHNYFLRLLNMLILPLESHLTVQILLFGSENYDSTANKIIISFCCRIYR